ncbi:hypothetical protein L8R85_23470 [Vibrio splendidus]|uniref:Adhesin n=2 Tax=Vibrio TaxID=662 RepID=A0AA43G1W3_VIBSP|nr:MULTISPECIES: hypothetical protein [Vibrio]MDH5923977.1 hypothetical protein [Vibrio splendidus]MDH5953176.1 hypothetical protein [Vibrio crassostreae]TCM99760.1 hypothetical protein EDB35_1498 [Vibrio crassostreae]CAK3009398.1 Ig-like domain-containing protein [Vibrio crassostreae]CAK3608422.1 Ig-like domain-containing protein [Vibrio crassostreae]
MLLRVIFILLSMQSTICLAGNVNVDLEFDYDPLSRELTEAGSSSYSPFKQYLVPSALPMDFGLDSNGYFGGTILLPNSIQSINLTSKTSSNTLQFQVIASRAKLTLKPPITGNASTNNAIYYSGTCYTSSIASGRDNYVKLDTYNIRGVPDCVSDTYAIKHSNRSTYIWKTIENIWYYKANPKLPLVANEVGTYKGTAVLTYGAKLYNSSGFSFTYHTLTVNITVNVTSGLSSVIAPDSVEVINSDSVGGQFSSSVSFPVVLTGFFDEKVKVTTTSANNFNLNCSSTVCTSSGKTDIPYTLRMNTNEVSQDVNTPSGTSVIEIPISAKDYNVTGGRYGIDFNLSYDVDASDVTNDTYNDSLTFIFDTIP